MCWRMVRDNLSVMLHISILYLQLHKAQKYAPLPALKADMTLDATKDDIKD